MSVDILGSTQFKQLLSQKGRISAKDSASIDDAPPSEPWLSPILEFYEQISTLFAEIWDDFSRKADTALEWPIGDRPLLWKAVGDELIFTKHLTDHRQAYVCIAAWAETAKRYRKRIKSHSSNLDLKCSSWVAGFPVNNAEVILEQHAAGGLAGCDDGDYIYGNLLRLEASMNGNLGNSGIRDFIGPSIDTGFRVGSMATPRRFVITADLALILAHIAGNLTVLTPPFTPLVFFYEGRKNLKGVTNGTPYPIFWINASDQDALTDIEDKLEGRQQSASRDVKMFCEHFLEKNKDTHVMRPFLINDPDPFFSRLPDRHKEKLRKLASYWKNESERRKNEQSAQLDDTDTQSTEDPRDNISNKTQELVMEIAQAMAPVSKQ